MGEFMDQIPGGIQSHLREIIQTSGLENNDESLEKMAQAWLEKQKAFEENIESQSMEELDTFSKDDERAVLVMTYSGSLLNAGPIKDSGRNIEYTSIGIRADVPNSAVGDNAVFSDDVEVDKELSFESGPIKSTSAVFKIAVCKENASFEEQEETLKNVTEVLEEEFTKINKTLILD
ncbi:MAG: hypothetical protein JW864_13485 [Spirochaetes bacterium]|nr:hypothetical protein [Spirochaetota bacterium]